MGHAGPQQDASLQSLQGSRMHAFPARVCASAGAQPGVARIIFSGVSTVFVNRPHRRPASSWRACCPAFRSLASCTCHCVPGSDRSALMPTRDWGRFLLCCSCRGVEGWPARPVQKISSQTPRHFIDAFSLLRVLCVRRTVAFRLLRQIRA